MQIGFEHNFCEDFEYLTSPLFSDEGVKHCFTTRKGGFSKGHLESLNLGLSRGDDEENLRKNFDVVCSHLKFTKENLSITKQIHKSEVAVITKPHLRSEGCDALVTDKKNIPLMSYSADCVCVIMYDKVKRACATVHSGWRGCASKICSNTIRVMREVYKSSPDDIICAIGPSIGKCCFEIKDDAVKLFKESFSDISFIEKQDDGIHYKADLWQSIIITLEESGVKNENISLSGECTCCNGDKYFSCRGQKGNFGAMGAFIEL